jgi:hypothetical protein
MRLWGEGKFLGRMIANALITNNISFGQQRFQSIVFA